MFLMLLSTAQAEKVGLLMGEDPAVAVEFQWVLNACFQRPVSIAIDSAAIDHHWFDNSNPPAPIVWQNPGAVNPTNVSMDYPERHRQYVGAAVAAFNDYTGRITERPGLQWTPLTVHHEGTTILRQAAVPFLDQCVAHNHTDASIQVDLREMVFQCNDGSLTNGRSVNVDYLQLPERAVVSANSSRTLYDILEPLDIPWRFSCAITPAFGQIPEKNRCYLRLSSVEAQKALGGEILTRSYRQYGNSGCNDFPIAPGAAGVERF